MCIYKSLYIIYLSLCNVTYIIIIKNVKIGDFETSQN